MDSTEEILADHERRLTNLEIIPLRVDGLDKGLETHKMDCEKLRQEMTEHNKRNDDALNHNTQSNILLAESNKELIQEFRAFRDHVEKEHEPVIAWYKPYIETGNDIKGFFRVNKVLIRWTVAGVITAAAFYHALQTFA